MRQNMGPAVGGKLEEERKTAVLSIIWQTPMIRFQRYHGIFPTHPQVGGKNLVLIIELRTINRQPPQRYHGIFPTHPQVGGIRPRSNNRTRNCSKKEHQTVL